MADYANVGNFVAKRLTSENKFHLRPETGKGKGLELFLRRYLLSKIAAKPEVSRITAMPSECGYFIKLGA